MCKVGGEYHWLAVIVNAAPPVLGTNRRRFRWIGWFGGCHRHAARLHPAVRPSLPDLVAMGRDEQIEEREVLESIFPEEITGP